MKNILAILSVLVVGVCAVAPVTAATIAELDDAFLTTQTKPTTTVSKTASVLLNGVVELYQGSSFSCTAFKVDDKKYITARHCVTGGFFNKYKIRGGGEWTSVSSITFPLEEQDDWAYLHLSKENKKIKRLSLDCSDKVSLGTQVAYLGFPVPLKEMFVKGSVTSVHPPDNRIDAGSDFLTDLSAGAGASGSPVMDLNSGRVIGILIEGFGGFAVGAQTISSTDDCKENF